MKFHFCQNDHNEITPAMSFILGYIMWTVIRYWPDTKLKMFHFAQNEISCKHALSIHAVTTNLFSQNMTCAYWNCFWWHSSNKVLYCYFLTKWENWYQEIEKCILFPESQYGNLNPVLITGVIIALNINSCYHSNDNGCYDIEELASRLN